MSSYLTPSGFGEAVLIEKKSKFIGRVFLVDTEERALCHIESIRKKHWDASHNVYAYSIRGGTARSSDDGEPQGTSGVPALEVFLKAGVTNFLCVITRYFGGTLLGAGGLVRAYGAAAKLALEAAGISRMEPASVFKAICPYALLERMKREIENKSGEVLKVDYEAEATLIFWVTEGEEEIMKARFSELSSGERALEFVEKRHVSIPVK